MFSFKIFGVEDISRAQDRLKGIRGGLRKAPRAGIKAASNHYMSVLHDEIPVSDRDDREHTRDLIEWGAIDTTEGGAEVRLKGPDWVQYMIQGTEGGQTIQGNPVLHFFWNGDEFFLTSVVRGATPANDFLRRSWQKARDAIREQTKELGLRVAHVEPIEE